MSTFEGGPSPEETGMTSPQEKKDEGIQGIKTGDVIDFAGNKVRVRGFSAPEGTPGRVFMVEDLKPEELEAYRQREQIILGKIINQIVANPNAIIDREQAMKFWGDLYDKAGNGEKMEMQLNEIYAQKYELSAKLARDRMLALESQLNFVQNEGEKQAILAKIVEEREFAIEMETEANARRGYNNPKERS